MSSSDDVLELFPDLAPLTDATEELLNELRTEALTVHRRERRPVSVNDVRHILTARNYAGDQRVLTRVFLPSEWRAVGTTSTECATATSDKVGALRTSIRTYIPVATMLEQVS